MSKREFLNTLRGYLRGFSDEEIERAVMYYDELISDKQEQGMSEKEAVRALGDVRTISRQLQAEFAGERFSGKATIAKAHHNFSKVLRLFATPALFPLGIVYLAFYIALAATVFALVVAFGAAAIALAAATVPGSIALGMEAGAPVGVMAAGVMLVVMAVSALLSAAFAKFGGKLLYHLMKGATALIRKIYGGNKI